MRAWLAAAEQELKEPVHNGAMQILAKSWQGQEQAAIMVGPGDYEPAAPRLVGTPGVTSGRSPDDEPPGRFGNWHCRTQHSNLSKAKRQTEIEKNRVG